MSNPFPGPIQRGESDAKYDPACNRGICRRCEGREPIQAGRRSSAGAFVNTHSRTVLWTTTLLAGSVLTACGAASSPGAAPPPHAAAAADTGGTSTTQTRTVSVRPPSSSQIQHAVRRVLSQAYGLNQYDAARQCWRHSIRLQAETRDYCLKVNEPLLVDTDMGTQVYLQTYSDPEAGLYSLADPGLQGLFAIQFARDGSHRLIASTPALTSGQAGNCACLDSRFLQVGPERHGWLSLDGGFWQGIEVSYHALYVIDGATFKTVASIPRRTEDAQNEHLGITIDHTATPTAGMFPLVVTRYVKDTPTESRRIEFDPTGRIYPWNP